MIEFYPPLKKYNERWEKRVIEQPKMAELRKILLNIGGKEVVPIYESYVDALIKNGNKITNPTIIHKPMKNSRCHFNSAYLYKENDSITSIGTGWALSDDELWRQHSWLFQDSKIIETTTKRKIYYGLILENEEANKFVKNNSIM